MTFTAPPAGSTAPANQLLRAGPCVVGVVALADADGNEVDLVPGDRVSKGPETADWQVLFGAMTFYPVDSPVRAGELASAVAGLADEAGLPLMVDLRPDGVTIDSGKDRWEDEEGSATSRFVDLAGRIQTAARDLGALGGPYAPAFRPARH